MNNLNKKFNNKKTNNVSANQKLLPIKIDLSKVSPDLDDDFWKDCLDKNKE